MSGFAFVVPGQPPSTNHIYVRVRGSWSKMTKAPGVEAYQNDVALICRSARPTGFHPTGQIRVRFWFHLKRDADADNLLKMLLDAVAAALEVNDRCFIPCVMEKTIGNKDPWTQVEVEEIGAGTPSSGPPG